MKLLVLATCLITVCWCQSEPNPNCFLPLDPGTPPPPKKGLWQKQQIKFYYDVMKRDCRAFGYHGSGGNNNSFNSYPECNTACGENAMWIKPGSWFWETKDKCDHSPDVGTCYGYMPRYFFNGTANMCQPFSYGGCGGNENNFPTIGDCVKRCGGIVYRKPQPLPKPGGPRQTAGGANCHDPPFHTGYGAECKAYFDRWSFNGNRCEKFQFGGCDGNGNNFESEMACVQACRSQQLF